MRAAVFHIAFNTFREIVRNKVLYAVIAFAFLLVITSAVFGSVTIGDRVTVIKDFGLFAVTLSGAIVVSLAGVSLLERELKQKTIYNLLSKSLSRAEFVVGKFLGLALVSSVMSSLMSLIFICFTAFFESSFDPLLFDAAFLVVLEMVLLSAVAIFFSSLVVTTVLSGIFTFITFLVGHSYRVLDYFIVAEDASPITQWLIKALKFVLPDLSVFNRADALVAGLQTPLDYMLSAILYCLLYSSALVSLSILAFQKRDFQ